MLNVFEKQGGGWGGWSRVSEGESGEVRAEGSASSSEFSWVWLH